MTTTPTAARRAGSTSTRPTAPPAARSATGSARGSRSYVYPNTPLSQRARRRPTRARASRSACTRTRTAPTSRLSSLATTYTTQLAQWRAKYPSLPGPVTNRTHCIVWSDWSSRPASKRANGIRLDTNYYYWPGIWVQNRPGFMTGSGMPMRFAGKNGAMHRRLPGGDPDDRRVGPELPVHRRHAARPRLGPHGYYGAFTANMHTDQPTIQQDDALLTSALVPRRAAGHRQADAHLARRPQRLVVRHHRVVRQHAVVQRQGRRRRQRPDRHGADAGPNGTQLTGINRNGSAVTWTPEQIKGLDYAVFSAAGGSYTALYAVPGAMAIAALSVDTGPAVADQTASLRWTTTSVATSEISLGTSTTKLTTTKAKGDATLKHSVSVSGLEAGTRYYYRVTSRDAKGVARTSPALTEAPASFVTPAEDTKKPTATAPVVTALPDGSARSSGARTRRPRGR